jgi:hypothetical protein
MNSKLDSVIDRESGRRRELGARGDPDSGDDGVTRDVLAVEERNGLDARRAVDRRELRMKSRRDAVALEELRRVRRRIVSIGALPWSYSFESGGR